MEIILLYIYYPCMVCIKVWFIKALRLLLANGRNIGRKLTWVLAIKTWGRKGCACHLYNNLFIHTHVCNILQFKGQILLYCTLSPLLKKHCYYTPPDWAIRTLLKYISDRVNISYHTPVQKRKTYAVICFKRTNFKCLAVSDLSYSIISIKWA